MALFNFPKPDRKTNTLLAFIVIECLAYFITLLIDGIQPFESKFFDQISQTVLFYPILIYKKYQKTQRVKAGLAKSRNSIQFKKLDYFALTIICSIDLISNLCFIIFDDQFKETYYFYNRETIQMILVLLFCKDFSKTLFYNHKLLSLFTFIVLTGILDVDLIRDKKDSIKFNALHISAYFITILFDAISISYKHYLFDVKYLTVEKVSIIYGTFSLFFMIIIIVVQGILGKKYCVDDGECLKIVSFKYHTFKDWAKIIFSCFTNSLGYYFLYKTLKAFTSNHILLCIATYIFFSNVKDFYSKENNIIKIIFFSVIFIFVIMSILVYVEIMELNFCGLNQYTRFNILKREQEEEKEDEEKILKKLPTSVELEGYLIHLNDSKENEEQEEAD